MTVLASFHYNSHLEVDFGPMRMVVDAQSAVRRSHYEDAAWYFGELATIAMPDLMHPGDLGIDVSNKMHAQDLAA